MLSDGYYNDVYNYLDTIKFSYSLEDFAKISNGISSEKKYAYLTYAISKKETVERHLLICEFLLFTDTFFYDVYVVLKWHLKRALEISPNNIKVLQWIVSTFNNHPDSPFNKEELLEYNSILMKL